MRERVEAEDAATTPAGAKPLGLFALFAISIGVVVGQSGMVTLMQGVSIGGWMFLAALCVAFVVGLINTTSYAELALMMPNARSLSSYTEAALGSFPAIFQVFAGYLTPTIFATPVELILVDTILSRLLPGVMPPLGWGLALLALMTGLNVLGADIFANIQTTLSFMMLLFLLLSGLAAVSGHHAGLLHPPNPKDALGRGGALLNCLALAFWMFMGSEFATPFVSISRNPARDLPRAMVLGMSATFTLQLLFAIGAAFVVSRDQMLSSALPHLDYMLAVFGPSARIWFGVVAITATASLINTILAALPRMLEGMAVNGQTFSIFGRTSRRRGTPVIGILFISVLPILGLIWSKGDAAAIVSLTTAASVAWLTSYIITQVSLVVLRRREPGMTRPFRAPGYPAAHLMAVLFMGFVVVETLFNPNVGQNVVAYSGLVIATAAIYSAVWTKFVMKVGLFAPRMPVDPMAA